MVSGSLALLYFLLGFYGERQGRGPNRGQSPVEWGKFFVRQFWLGLRPGWMAQRGGCTYKRTDGRTENLPILQDFVAYRGRCPKNDILTPFSSPR